MKRFLILFSLLSLGGCGTATTLPHNEVRLAYADSVCDLAGKNSGERTAALREAMANLPLGQRFAVVTADAAMPPKERTAFAAALYGGGIPQDRVTWKPGGKSALRVQFRTLRPVTTPETALAGEPHWYSSAAVSQSHGQATEFNLGAQLSSPEELAAPTAIGKANPISATGAVERYQTGQVRGLPEQSIEAGKAGK